MKDYLKYKGKTVVVTGGASGCGYELIQSLLEMEAIVYAIDIRNVDGVHKYIKADLSKKEEIDNAIAQLPEKIDCFFQNAALPGVLYLDMEYEVMDVFNTNYVAARYLIEAISERMESGGAMCITSSITGNYFMSKIDLLKDLYETGDTYEKAVAWGESHKDMEETMGGEGLPQNLYVFTKEALNYMMMRKANELMMRGIRLNALAPGAIETDMTPDFGRLIVKFEQYEYAEENAYSATSPSNRRSTTAREQADCLLFLNSDLSKVMNGAILNSDLGFQAGVDMGICTLGGIILDPAFDTGEEPDIAPLGQEGNR